MLWALPASAATCGYDSSDGGRVTFLNNDDNGVTVERAGQSKLDCSWGVSGETGMPDIECNDGTKGDYFFAPATLHGTSRDLLIFADQVWYRSCP